MKLLVISTAPIVIINGEYKAYSPYVEELILWQKYSDEIEFCCPTLVSDNNLLLKNIPFNINKLYVLRGFDIKSKSIKNILNVIVSIFINLQIISKAIYNSDHVHLRCPGNIGLLASVVQIFFPSKIKTAKYAGNWDSNSIQPISYRIQKWILSNTFLTKKMNVLVYGNWKNQSKNIKSFFTASYKKSEIEYIESKELSSKIRFLFVGTLSIGKRPLYAVQMVERLMNKGFNVQLELFGEGNEREKLEKYIEEKSLKSNVFLRGNQHKDIIKIAYQESHFLILPSKSEGWPKVVAEAMFWKCLPIASKVSCVADMLDNGNSGVILSMNLDEDVQKTEQLLNNQLEYNTKVESAQKWSHNYTIDKFEGEIKLLLQS